MNILLLMFEKEKQNPKDPKPKAKAAEKGKVIACYKCLDYRVQSKEGNKTEFSEWDSR